MPITDAYNAPVKDMKFVLHELWDASELSTYEGYEDASPDLIDAMLEKVRLALQRNRLHPIERILRVIILTRAQLHEQTIGDKLDVI